MSTPVNVLPKSPNKTNTSLLLLRIDLADLEEIQVPFPLTVKPAIKEHFFYATKAKAWRANNRTGLRELFQRASAQDESWEVMIQDLIPAERKQEGFFASL